MISVERNVMQKDRSIGLNDDDHDTDDDWRRQRGIEGEAKKCKWSKENKIRPQSRRDERE